MPPRMALQGALRASKASTPLLRAFSTTTCLAAPPRDGAAASSQPPTSSSNSLLSINKNDRAPPRANANAGGSFNKGDAASRLLSRYKDRADAAVRSKQAQLEFLRDRKNSNDYLKQMPRRWEAGDVYSPHDLSPVEMQKWRKRTPRKSDVVDALGINPLDMYKNFSLVQEFTSSSGQITHSSVTSLRAVNQRKIAKMIRRVQGMGLYPTIHDHPEMIRDNFFPGERR